MPHPPTLFLIRHATPDWNRTDISYHLPPGPPLTPQGEKEAAQLGVFLRDVGVAHIFVSPLERALRTAKIATTVASVPVEPEDGLTEWQPGEEAAVVRARFEPVWEMARALCQRVGPIALITHGGPIALHLEALGMARDTIDSYRRKFDRNNPVPPAGAWKAVYTLPESAWDLSLAFVPANDGNANVAYA
jgi:probable phosphoglycerate mutase